MSLGVKPPSRTSDSAVPKEADAEAKQIAEQVVNVVHGLHARAFTQSSHTFFSPVSEQVQSATEHFTGEKYDEFTPTEYLQDTYYFLKVAIVNNIAI